MRKEVQQLGAQGRTAASVLPDRSHQQGLAADVESVYRSVSLGENAQPAGKAARPPARSSFHQWLG